jgi:hypothetical protein
VFVWLILIADYGYIRFQIFGIICGQKYGKGSNSYLAGSVAERFSDGCKRFPGKALMCSGRQGHIIDTPANQFSFAAFWQAIDIAKYIERLVF